jgi:Ca2+-binding RTX toxin-like protein
MTVATDYTAILYTADGQPNIAWNGMTAAGTPVIVTYSFVVGADLAEWEAGSSYSHDGYTSLTTAQRANFRDALALYEQAAGIRFVEVGSGEGMINAMNTSGSSWGGWANTAYSTEHHTGAGELVIDNTGNYDEGSFGFQTILHELGHAMGLQHPWEGNVTLDDALDDQWHTVMTYQSSWPYTDDLGTLDVAAMRAQYGAASATAGWVLGFAAGVLSVTGSSRGDSILGVAGRNLLEGAGGADSLLGRQADDTLRGGEGDDHIWGNVGNDGLYGAGGNDALYGFSAAVGWANGSDSLYGGAGRDSLMGGSNADALFGGAGRDLLDGRGSEDQMRGGAGADTLTGGAGAWGNQVMYGDGGSDVLRGENGNDALYGGAQGDTLEGGGGWDSLFGDDGDDVLFGGGTGSVKDTFTGGTGADRFVFTPADGASTMYITDFTRGEDKIDLTAMAVGWADVGKSGTWLIVEGLWINTTVTAQIAAGDFVF